MSERTLAAASYLPIPGLAYLLAYAQPASRLVRFHSRQGGLLWLIVFPLLAVVGVVAQDGGPLARALSMVAGVTLALTLGGCVWMAVQAARGQFTRLRPVWDLQAALARGRDSPRPN